jgi:hypothetical protein
MSMTQSQKRSANKRTTSRSEFHFPEWTEQGSRAGLDPLGMQNASIDLYQKLLPGIGNVTLRVRYYGLYAWLSWIYAKRIGDTSRTRWKWFVRRAEALYALAGQRAGETGVAGINWAKRTLDEKLAGTIDFSESAEPGSPKPYFAVEWGVFGLAYQSQLFETGVLATSNEHGVGVPSPEIGEPLALAFHHELGDLAEPFYDAIVRGHVDIAELDQLGAVNASMIRKDSVERLQYEQLLFGLHEPRRANDAPRRQSLRLILELAALLKRKISADDFRWALFTGEVQRGTTFNISLPDVEAHRRRWFVYQTNDLCHIALETLLKYALDTLASYSRRVPLSFLLDDCVKQLMRVAHPRPTSWNQFLDGLPADKDGNGRARATGIERALVEDVLKVRDSSKLCTAELASKAVALLGHTHLLARQNPTLIERAFGHLDQGLFHSLLTESRFLNHYGDAEFVETIRRIIHERVIRRHLWVALRKLRHQGDYTFLIEVDDGLIRLRGKDGPMMTNPRVGPAIRFLTDIHLIGDRGLTSRGAEVLKSL